MKLSDDYTHHHRISKKRRGIFHKLEYADVLRPGVCLTPKGLFLALPLSRGPRPHLAWIGVGRDGLTYSFDFMRDHAMWRPWDIDSRTHLECRHCGAIAGNDAPDYCGGFVVSRRGGESAFNVTKAEVFS